MSQLAIDKPNLHIAMYPWLAMGHLTPFLELANKLAERGHKTSFFIPPKTQRKLASFNHHPHLITFIPVPIPPVDGLPDGAETTHDVPPPDRHLIITAMDLTYDTIDSYLARLKPNIIFFDFAEWLPALAKRYGVKPVYYYTTLMFPFAYLIPQARNLPANDYSYKESDLLHPPQDFPAPNVRLAAHEARAMVYIYQMDVGGKKVLERRRIAFEECDAMMFKTCREMEGPFCEFVGRNMNKPMFLAGPKIPDRPDSRLNEDIDGWLKGFAHGTVVYCALGSECALQVDHFHELILGLELTGRPFLAALKPPVNYQTIESALPKGLLERTKDRGLVHWGWVQQQLILRHPSVGCFVTHCGAGSLLEALMSDCQIVMLPQAVDQFLNARLMSSYLRVGVEIEKRDDDGFFTRGSVRKGINLVMEEDSDEGREVRANHAKWKELLSKDGLEDSYIDELVQNLQGLVAQE